MAQLPRHTEFLSAINFGEGVVATELSAAGTSLVVDAGHSFLDPATYGRYVIGWQNTNDLALVTGLSGNTLTIQRDYDGSTGIVHAVDEVVEVVLSAKMYTDLRDRVYRLERAMGGFFGGGDGLIANSAYGAITQQSTPNMTVQAAAGFGFISGETIEIDAGSDTDTITAPSTNNRIDRVVFTLGTGLTVVTGVESGSPSAPATPSESISLATILLTPSHTDIDNADITDARDWIG